MVFEKRGTTPRSEEGLNRKLLSAQYFVHQLSGSFGLRPSTSAFALRAAANRAYLFRARHFVLRLVAEPLSGCGGAGAGGASVSSVAIRSWRCFTPAFGLRVFRGRLRSGRLSASMSVRATAFDRHRPSGLSTPISAAVAMPLSASQRCALSQIYGHPQVRRVADDLAETQAAEALAEAFAVAGGEVIAKHHEVAAEGGLHASSAAGRDEGEVAPGLAQRLLQNPGVDVAAAIVAHVDDQAAGAGTRDRRRVPTERCRPRPWRAGAGDRSGLCPALRSSNGGYFPVLVAGWKSASALIGLKIAWRASCHRF